MLQFTYLVKLTRERKDGGYVVSWRDIPEAITQGDSIEYALSEAEGALQAAIECRIEDGLDTPAPLPAKRGERLAPTPIITALKAAIYTEMRGQRVSKSELARRMPLMSTLGHELQYSTIRANFRLHVLHELKKVPINRQRRDCHAKTTV